MNQQAEVGRPAVAPAKFPPQTMHAPKDPLTLPRDAAEPVRDKHKIALMLVPITSTLTASPHQPLRRWLHYRHSNRWTHHIFTTLQLRTDQGIKALRVKIDPGLKPTPYPSVNTGSSSPTKSQRQATPTRIPTAH